MEDSNPATKQSPSKAASEAEIAAYYEQYQQYYQQCYPYYQQYGYNGYDINSEEYRQYYAQLCATQQQQPQEPPPQPQQNGSEATTEVDPVTAAPAHVKALENASSSSSQAANASPTAFDNCNDVDVDSNSTLLTNVPTTTKPLQEWTHVEVADWVRTVQNGAFAEYAPSFVQNEVNGSVLSTMTEQQLQRGLYMNNMMQRLQFHDLIQQLKQTRTHDHAHNETAVTAAVPCIAVADLERAPPIKKRRRKPKSGTGGGVSAHEHEHAHRPADEKSRQSTAAFLKLNAQQQANCGKSSSQLLMEKMASNSHHKRSLQDMQEDEEKEQNAAGELVEIEWRYNDRESYRDLHIHVHDRVLFKWEFTKNVWQFSNKKAFAENEFNTTVAEELCGCDCEQFMWRATKTGVFYFGCQVAECAKSGNMKIRIRVSSNHDNNNNNNKKQRIE